MFKDILNKLKIAKYLNLIVLCVLSLAVIGLLSSFVIHLTEGDPDPTVDSGIEKMTPNEVIQINILNGCGEAGLAGKARRYLRARGFDVVEIGNAKKRIDESIIIDRVGDLSSAKKVAYAIGMSNSMIKTEIDSSLFLRSTIIIGKDYRDLDMFR